VREKRIYHARETCGVTISAGTSRVEKAPIDTGFGRPAMNFIEFDQKPDPLVLAPGKAAVWDSALPLFHLESGTLIGNYRAYVKRFPNQFVVGKYLTSARCLGIL
jgi:hypothetical protein